MAARARIHKVNPAAYYARLLTTNKIPQMNATKREIRTIDCCLALREAPQDAQGESRTIVGTAIVFNRESQVLDDWGERFKEVILPEAATLAFLNSQDIKMNMLHERELTIARSNKGEGSLRLSVDENGVHFEFDAPRCDLGDRCLELVRTGVYSGCSFEFYPKDYDIERNGDEVTITHRAFEAITAITIGMDPAYLQTAVNVRELKNECGDEPEERACDDDKREDDEQEKPDEEQENKEKEQREAMRAAAERRRILLNNDNPLIY